jgi:hypothetical protein
MGLFDTVHFESPEKFAQMIDWGDFAVPSQVISQIKENNSFQTKCLSNSLTDHVITIDGNLKSQNFEDYQFVLNDDAPIKNSIKQKGEYWLDENIHGKIKIYCSEIVDFLDQDWWLDFELKFTDGTLETITCVDAEAIFNYKRKELQAELSESLRKRTEMRKKIDENKFLSFYFRKWVHPQVRLTSLIYFKYPKLRKILNIYLKIFVPLSGKF